MALLVRVPLRLLGYVRVRADGSESNRPEGRGANTGSEGSVSLLLAKTTRIGRPCVVADPSEGFEPAAEPSHDRGRKPCVRVFKASREQVALTRPLEGNKLRQASTRMGILGGAIPCPRFRLRTVNQQIDLTCESRQGRHYHIAVVLDDELRDEDRVIEIRKTVVETLARVHATQRIQVGGRVFADSHRIWRSESH